MIYKDIANIECHNFVTELYFVGVKLREEKRKLFNQNDFVKIRTLGGLFDNSKNM